MRIELPILKYFMKSVFVVFFLLSGLVSQSKSYLKIELDNTNHIVIFDGSLYTVNGKFEGEIDGGKHAISILKHNYNLTTSKVKTDVIYEGTLDLTDNMFYVYKLSSGYLSFVSVDVYSPVVSTVLPSNSQESSSNSNNNASLTTGTAMDDATFITFITKMKDKSMDNQKLDFAKSTMKNNWFNTDQVLQMLQTFSMENNKVELAKLIWHKTTDKGSFFKIYDAFTFSSSEKSVQEYVDAQN
jgi:hypothetical protein